MKYALIKDTLKIISIKEVTIDKVLFTVSITSTNDDIYLEQYITSDEILKRLLELNGGFNSTIIRNWWDSFV
tara:strand:- start:734 stop:949 length:216 start_codon:yes stop_codon:yes gene_type:complete